MGVSAGAVPSPPELAQPWTYYQHTRQRRPASGAVDDGRSGEVLESQVGQPSTAPGPGADNWVDDGSQY